MSILRRNRSRAMTSAPYAIPQIFLALAADLQKSVERKVSEGINYADALDAVMSEMYVSSYGNAVRQAFRALSAADQWKTLVSIGSQADVAEALRQEILGAFRKIAASEQWGVLTKYSSEADMANALESEIVAAFRKLPAAEQWAVMAKIHPGDSVAAALEAEKELMLARRDPKRAVELLIKEARVSSIVDLNRVPAGTRLTFAIYDPRALVDALPEMIDKKAGHIRVKLIANGDGTFRVGSSSHNLNSNSYRYFSPGAGESVSFGTPIGTDDDHDRMLRFASAIRFKQLTSGSCYSTNWPSRQGGNDMLVGECQLNDIDAFVDSVSASGEAPTDQRKASKSSTGAK